MVVRKSTMGTVEDGTKVFSLEVYFPVVCTVLMLGSIQVFHQGDIGFKCWYRYTMNNLDDDRFDAQSLHHKLKPTAEYSKVWVFVMSDGAQKRVQGVDQVGTTVGQLFWALESNWSLGWPVYVSHITTWWWVCACLTRVVGLLTLIPPAVPAACDMDVSMVFNLWLCEPFRDWSCKSTAVWPVQNQGCWRDC